MSPEPRPNIRPAVLPPVYAAPIRRVPPPRPPIVIGARRASPSGQRVGFGDALRLEPALRVDGGHAAVTRRGDGLAIAVVVDVSGDEHAFDLGVGLVADDEVALGVDLEPFAECLGVRL